MSTYEEEARGARHAWVGAEPEFVRSRKERGPNERVNSKEGLSGVALELLTGDDNAKK
jgi:phosphoglucan,water dikinase